MTNREAMAYALRPDRYHQVFSPPPPTHKNPAIGEPKGPSMTDYQLNRQRAGNKVQSERIAAYDKMAMEGIRQRQRIAKPKAENEARRRQRHK